MTDAREHVDHCDILITGCLHTVERGRALGCHVALDDDMSALDLLVVAETLAGVAGRIASLATERAGAN